MSREVSPGNLNPPTSRNPPEIKTISSLANSASGVSGWTKLFRLQISLSCRTVDFPSHCGSRKPTQGCTLQSTLNGYSVCSENCSGSQISLLHAVDCVKFKGAGGHRVRFGEYLNELRPLQQRFPTSGANRFHPAPY